MFDRQEEVGEAFEDSYAWIFEDGNGIWQGGGKKGTGSEEMVDNDGDMGCDFKEWLEEVTVQGEHSHVLNDSTARGSLYWISGLPGSGKSTLLSFLCSHPRTHQILSTWATRPTGSSLSHSGGATSLQMAKFFCWISGSKEQRSISGCLRTILYQLLESAGPGLELVSLVFPTRWKTLWSMTTKERIKAVLPWTEQELMTGLYTYLTLTQNHMRVCLFIDGLDELEGDHEAITMFLKKLVEDFGLKICVSSRPWEAFEKAFKGTRALRLQDLTREDMRKYARLEFGKDEVMSRIGDDGERDKLIRMLVDRAKGAFLWITLVVRLLLERLEEADTIETLTTRSLELPEHLNALFSHTLLHSGNTGQTAVMSTIFQLLRAREYVCAFTGDEQAASMTVLDMARAYEADQGLAAATLGLRQATVVEIRGLCNRMIGRIERSCSSLLTVYDRRRRAKADSMIPSSRINSRIVYAHRTVRDFLADPEVWQTVERLVEQKDFDPHACHLRGYIHKLKISIEPLTKDRLLGERWPDIILAMTHARFTKIIHLDQKVELLDTLNRVLQQRWRRKGDDAALDSWARDSFGSFEDRKQIPFHDPFLSIAVKFGLVDYVEAKLLTGRHQYISGAPLLAYSLEYLFDRQRSVFPLSSPEMVAMLLKHGGHGDPNMMYKGIGKSTTPWIIALDSARQACRRGWIEAFDISEFGAARWYTIFRTLIQHGIDRTQFLPTTPVDEGGTAPDIWTKIVNKYGSSHAATLKQTRFVTSPHTATTHIASGGNIS